MDVSLSYAFDTTKSGKRLLKGALLFQAFLVAALIADFEPRKLFTVIFISAITMSVGIFTFRTIGGAFGAITKHEISVKPSALLGIRSASPEGRFALTQFDGIRVDILSAPQGDVLVGSIVAGG